METLEALVAVGGRHTPIHLNKITIRKILLDGSYLLSHVNNFSFQFHFLSHWTIDKWENCPEYHTEKPKFTIFVILYTEI